MPDTDRLNNSDDGDDEDKSKIWRWFDAFIRLLKVVAQLLRAARGFF